MNLRNILSKLMFLLVIALFISCSQEEKIINNIESQFKVLVAAKNDFSVKLISYPSKEIINNNILSDLANPPLGPITKIREFRNLVYLFSPASKKMYVYNKSTYKFVSELTFENGKVGTDIVFPNATDAYILSEEANSLFIYDLTVSKIVREISVGKKPVAANVSGNQIFVCCTDDNSVSVVDIRTRIEEAKIAVDAVPYYVAPCNDGKSMCVICLGNGKVDQIQGQNKAIADFIDINSREVKSKTDIGLGNIDPAIQKPQGLYISSLDWVFVPTQDNFFRIDAQNSAKINLVTRRNYQLIEIIPQTKELLLLRNTNGLFEIVTADSKTGGAKSVYQIPEQNISTIYPQ